MDSAKLTIVATYLQHTTMTYASCLFFPASLDAVAQVAISSPDSAPADHILESWTHRLRGCGSILAWVPHLLRHLPSVTVDTLVTRAYSALVRASAAHSAAFPRTVFSLRLYALRCLLRASPSASQVRPATVWDQAVKFCASFLQKTRGVKTMVGGGAADAKWALDAVAQFVADAQERADAKQFVGDKAFVSFCECWADLATQV